MTGATPSSRTVMKARVPAPTISHASGEIALQLSPAMIVCRSPPATRGSPAHPLRYSPSAESGSTTTAIGRSRPSRSHRWPITAAARPPTPPWTKTWVGPGAPDSASASSASSTMTVYPTMTTRGISM